MASKLVPLTTVEEGKGVVKYRERTAHEQVHVFSLSVLDQSDTGAHKALLYLPKVTCNLEGKNHKVILTTIPTYKDQFLNYQFLSPSVDTDSISCSQTAFINTCFYKSVTAHLFL